MVDISHTLYSPLAFHPGLVQLYASAASVHRSAPRAVRLIQRNGRITAVRGCWHHMTRLSASSSSYSSWMGLMMRLLAADLDLSCSPLLLLPLSPPSAGSLSRSSKQVQKRDGRDFFFCIISKIVLKGNEDEAHQFPLFVCSRGIVRHQ